MTNAEIIARLESMPIAPGECVIDYAGAIRSISDDFVARYWERCQWVQSSRDVKPDRDTARDQLYTGLLR